MQPFEIRKVTIEDVATLSTVAKQSFFEAFTGTCTAADMNHFFEQFYTEDILLTELLNTNIHYYFALVGNAVAGYFSYAENNEQLNFLAAKRNVELKRFYVLPAYHGIGVAQQMMDFYLAYAQANAYDNAFLGVWEYNYKAQNFYKKYGFVQTAYRHPFPIGNTPQTDVYFVKKLAS